MSLFSLLPVLQAYRALLLAASRTNWFLTQILFGIGNGTASSMTPKSSQLVYQVESNDCRTHSWALNSLYHHHSLPFGIYFRQKTHPSNGRTIPKQILLTLLYRSHILLTLLYRSSARIKNIFTTPGGGRGGNFPMCPSWVCSFISTVPQNKTHFIFFYL